MTDQYYTPGFLADRMLAAVSNLLPQVIADFAAGDGGLLRPAHHRWPGASIVASDANIRSVRRLRRQFTQWHVSCCDFLSDSSVERSRYLATAWGCVDLVLLNPPFSMRGGQYWEARINTSVVRCGLAMAFLCKALSFLSSDGEIVAVLPESALFSQRDAIARTLLLQRYDIRIVEHVARGAFPGCAARCVVVHGSRRTGAARDVLPPQPASGCLQVVRGSAQMHSLSYAPGSRGRRLVHSTNLRRQNLVGPFRRVYSERVLRGPCVLLPRVGRLSPEKIVSVVDARPFVLSDCVIAALCRDAPAAERLSAGLRENWVELSHCYHGTGAPYTTIAAVVACLYRCGLTCCVLALPDSDQVRSAAYS